MIKPAPVVKTVPTRQQSRATQATNTGFFTVCSLGWSNRVETTPSMMPIWDPMPSVINIMKNRADHSGAPGIFVNT